MFNMNQIQFAFCSLALSATASVSANESVARQWNELLLESIAMTCSANSARTNLFHTSAAMWDAWSCFEEGPALGSSMSRSCRPEILILLEKRRFLMPRLAC